MVLKAVGIDNSLVTYKDADSHTTKAKTIDCSRAIHDLKHDQKVPPGEGIKRIVDWIKWYNRMD